MASSASGSWSNIQPDGLVTVGASWSASCSVENKKVIVTINVTFKAVSGDECSYSIWADGESKASHSGTHYVGSSKTLTYSFTESVDSSKTITKSFGAWVKASGWTEFGGKDTTVTLTYDYTSDYTVTYAGNGGSGTMSQSIATEGSDFITRKNAFTRYGYIFVGWNEAQDGSGTWWNIPNYVSGVYSEGASGSKGVYESGLTWTWAYDHNLTLYAQWIPIKVTVTFNSNASDSSIVNTFEKQTYETGASGIYFKGSISRKHFNCLGWALDKGSATATYSLNSWVRNEFIVANTPEVTLYAVWQAKEKYTLTVESDSLITVELDEDDSYTLPTTAPSKAAENIDYSITYDSVETDATISRNADTAKYKKTYSFTKWNTASDASGKDYSLGNIIGISQDTHLYTFFDSSESWQYVDSSGNTVSEFPTGTLEQMKLIGWCLSKDSASVASWPPQYKYNLTLYALWSPDGTGGFLKYYVNSDTEPTLPYKTGSKVRIVGLKDAENDAQYTIAAISTKQESDGVWGVALSFESNFTVSGQQDASNKNVQIWGEGSYIPDLDYICGKDNRLWGCNSDTRTIYASALGDPTDFWTFEGSTLDAYQVAVASANKFTGIIPLNSQIVFMKQHTIHKMLGSYPSEYSLYEYNLEGVDELNAGSLVNMEGTALYLAEHGISSYSGTSVTNADSSLGDSKKEKARAMYDGEKYFLYFKDSEGADKTYIYDSRYGIWTQEEYGKVLDFIHYQNDNYILAQGNDGTNRILKVTSGLERSGSWEITFKPFIETVSTTKTTTHIFEKKRYTKLTIRLELSKKSWIKAEAKYDGKDKWHQLAMHRGKTDGVCDFVINTPRVDKLQLRLSGSGAMTILAMERAYQVYSRR